MKTGEFPWEARVGETLDPRLVNENFRKAVDYIKDASSLRYTYSEMVFNLDGIDPSDAKMRKRRFIVTMPPMLASNTEGSTNIVGGELSCMGMSEGDNIWVKWLATDELASVVYFIDPGEHGVTVDVITPLGGPTKSWRYLEVNGTDEFPLDEDINQRYLRMGDNIPLGVHVLEIGTDSGFDNANASCSLKLWIRHDRGSTPDISTPQLYSGDDPPDADIFNDALSSVQSDYIQAVAGDFGGGITNETWKVEAFVVKDLAANLAEIQAKMHARIPCPNSDDVSFKVMGISMGFVARDDTGFANSLLSREFKIRIAAFNGGIVLPELMTDLNSADGPVFDNYTEIFRSMRSDGTINPIELGRTGSDPTDPAEDNQILVEDELPAGSNPIEMIYVYVFYICDDRSV